MQDAYPINVPQKYCVLNLVAAAYALYCGAAFYRLLWALHENANGGAGDRCPQLEIDPAASCLFFRGRWDLFIPSLACRTGRYYSGISHGTASWAHVSLVDRTRSAGRSPCGPVAVRRFRFLLRARPQAQFGLMTDARCLPVLVIGVTQFRSAGVVQLRCLTWFFWAVAVDIGVALSSSFE